MNARLAFVPEWILGFVVFIAVAYGLWMHWEFHDVGGPFQVLCTSEDGGFFHRLFVDGHITHHRWWYGLGNTWAHLLRYPVFVYAWVRLLTLPWLIYDLCRKPSRPPR